MKIISYNVNGIRAALNKGLAEWLLATDADCICMQEVKATSDQVNSGAFENVGYGHHYWQQQKLLCMLVLSINIGKAYCC